MIEPHEFGIGDAPVPCYDCRLAGGCPDAYNRIECDYWEPEETYDPDDDELEVPDPDE